MMKKAMAMSWVIAMVAMLVVIIVLIPIPKLIGGEAERGAARAACVKSLDISENLKAIGADLIDNTGNVIKIDCQTEYIEAREKGDELLKVIANNLYDCWSIYKGRKKLFNQEIGTYCIICKDITLFSDEGKLNGLVDYLKTKKAPTAAGGTYIDNLGGLKNLPPSAEALFNFYPFVKSDEIAVVVTFGSKGFTGNRLIFDQASGIGLLLHPYKNVNLSGLGCYSFEGRTTSLEFKR